MRYNVLTLKPYCWSKRWSLGKIEKNLDDWNTIEQAHAIGSIELNRSIIFRKMLFQLNDELYFQKLT